MPAESSSAADAPTGRSRVGAANEGQSDRLLGAPALVLSTPKRSAKAAELVTAFLTAFDMMGTSFFEDFVEPELATMAYEGVKLSEFGADIVAIMRHCATALERGMRRSAADGH